MAWSSVFTPPAERSRFRISLGRDHRRIVRVLQPRAASACRALDQTIESSGQGQGRSGPFWQDSGSPPREPLCASRPLAPTTRMPLITM